MAGPTVTVTLELSQRVADLLTVLTTGQYAPDDLLGVIMELVDHAQQGVYRPGAWERGWLERAFGDDWQAGLEPDTERTAGDGRIVFDRPIKPCPNTPPCEHPLSVHVGEDGPQYCLECACGDEPEEDGGRPCCDHCNNLEGDPDGHDYGDESAHDGPCAECAAAPQ